VIKKCKAKAAEAESMARMICSQRGGAGLQATFKGRSSSAAGSVETRSECGVRRVRDLRDLLSSLGGDICVAGGIGRVGYFRRQVMTAVIRKLKFDGENSDSQQTANYLCADSIAATLSPAPCL
jgi:hypothetical protein